MDVILYRSRVPDGVHRVGGHDVVLHLGVPGQGSGQEHVLQREQHHPVLPQPY